MTPACFKVGVWPKESDELLLKKSKLEPPNATDREWQGCLLIFD